MNTRLPLLPVLSLLAALAGCGKSGLPMVPVSGKITFAGGPCPAAGNITFAPIRTPGAESSGGLPKRPGSGTFLQDGVFEVTSFHPGDGLLPGKYKVTITCVSGMPDVTKPDPWDAVSYVPKNYQPPDLELTAESEPQELSFDVPPKKR